MATDAGGVFYDPNPLPLLALLFGGCRLLLALRDISEDSLQICMTC